MTYKMPKFSIEINEYGNFSTMGGALIIPAVFEKSEKLDKIKTELLPMGSVKSIIFRSKKTKNRVLPNTVFLFNHY